MTHLGYIGGDEEIIWTIQHMAGILLLTLRETEFIDGLSESFGYITNFLSNEAGDPHMHPQTLTEYGDKQNKVY